MFPLVAFWPSEAKDGVKNGVRAHRASFFSPQVCPRQTCLERNSTGAFTHKHTRAHKTHTGKDWKQRVHHRSEVTAELIIDNILLVTNCRTDLELLIE